MANMELLSKRVWVVLAAAFAFRLFFALGFPHVAGDSPIYESFARNLRHYHVYSHYPPENGVAPAPSLIRPPGYPVFLAAVFSLAGDNNETAVRIVQALLDTVTCLLIALLVFEMAEGHPCRRRLAEWALTLASAAPFLANFCATILTEVPATLLVTAATLCGLRALKGRSVTGNWFSCGLLTGAATLFRAESGLLLCALGLILVVRDGPRHLWRPLLRGAGLMGLGLLIVLIPWTVRNVRTLGVFQPLAPFYAQDPDEFVPRGYYDWCRTWMWTFSELSDFLWPLEDRAIPVASLPRSAADDEGQRRLTLDLLERHNLTLSLDQSDDDSFESIARARRSRHPIRYYLGLPFLRSVALWFTPRVEILPLEGKLVPVRSAWENDPRDFLFTLALFTINLVYLALAAWGSWKILVRRPALLSPEILGLCVFAACIVTRTLFLAYSAFPEPRYILEAYPGVIALAAFSRRGHGDSRRCPD